jgi:predicted amidohydrolase
MVKWKVAAAQYPIDLLADWDAYETKIRRWVGEASAKGAALTVFPEYGAMELASLDPATMGDLARSIETVSALLPRVDALHSTLAVEHGLYILAASAPKKGDDGRFRNSARLFSPQGAMGTQDKLIMTRFEREEWLITAGNILKVFDTALGRIAVTICYDCEFPLLARAAIEAGAEVILVPSCTDTLQGYWRVRIGAQARALEGQCYVVQSPTVGDASWSLAVDINRGAAGIYAPPDRGMPDDGMLAIGTEGQPEWVYADIDLTRTREIRKQGNVLNMLHWMEQPGAAPLPHVELERL